LGSDGWRESWIGSGSQVAERLHYAPDADDGRHRQCGTRKRVAERGSQKRFAGTNGEGDFSSRVSPGSRLPITVIGVGWCGVLGGRRELRAGGRTRLHPSGRVVLFAVRSSGIGGGGLYRVLGLTARCRARPVQARPRGGLNHVPPSSRSKPSVMRASACERRPRLRRPGRCFSRSVPGRSSALCLDGQLPNAG